MEGLCGNNNSRVRTLNSLNSNVSPINPQSDINHFFIGAARYHPPPKSSIFDVHASSENFNSDKLDSPFIRYLRSASPVAAAKGESRHSPTFGRYYGCSSNSSGGSSGGNMLRGSFSSPLSAIDNLDTSSPRSPSVFKTPVKVEEDVIVMDGILVSSSPGARARSSSSSSGSNNSFYKTETCRSWEDYGSCRYGSKCQFAHGKEELCPTRFPGKTKFEAQICKSYNLGSCTYGTKCRFVHHQVTTGPSTVPTTAAEVRATTQPILPIKLDQATSGRSGKTFSLTTSDWSPQDDGIEVRLPLASTDKIPSKEDIDTYIRNILYGSVRGKRLPLFTEICPD